jgi:membrane-bound serine protease (ClpP class)
MAPGTNLGAATPVQIGGPAPGLPDTTPDKDGKNSKDNEHTLAAKATNDAVAFIRSLAELRGRNADWAEKAVREAASLSANAALQERVIDLVARDPVELLKRVDGRTVEVAGGVTRRLATKDAVIQAIDSGWISRFLAVITDPNVAFILLMVGTYGLIFEFVSPGAVAPGIVGTICLLLGLYALNLLPINYAGLALMLVGITLLTIETFNPTVVLGLGGLIAFVLGAVMLLRVEAPGYRLSWWSSASPRHCSLVSSLSCSARCCAPAKVQCGSVRRPCGGCPPRSSTGPRTKVTSSRRANAGERVAPRPPSPERWLWWPTSRI